MRSRLAARSTRLVLAAAVMTALAATTACGPQDSKEAGGSTAPAASSSASGGSEKPAGDGTSAADAIPAKDSGSDNSGSGNSSGKGSSGSGGSGDKGGTGGGAPGGQGGSGAGERTGYGQACGTNDLTFTVTGQSDPDVGGYYLVAARAKSGITCYLDVNTPSVSFGSGADGVASPVGQGGEDPIKLTGSAVAYTGIDAKTTGGDAGTEFGNVIIAVTEDDPDPAELELPGTATVDKPVVTNWSTRRDETVPHII